MQKQDPLTSDLTVDPVVVLGINFVVLMAAIMSFSQAVRMYIHAVRAPFNVADLFAAAAVVVLVAAIESLSQAVRIYIHVARACTMLPLRAAVDVVLLLQLCRSQLAKVMIVVDRGTACLPGQRHSLFACTPPRCAHRLALLWNRLAV
jgi:hypothetical protein